MRTLGQITELIRAEAAKKVDVTARVCNIEMGTDRIVKVRTEQGTLMEITPRERSMQQIGAKIGVPGQFLFRCYENEPALAAEIFNTFMQRYRGEKGPDFPWLLRTERMSNGGHLLRAALTEKYGILDNDQMVDTLSEYFPADTPVTAYHGNNDFTAIHLRVPGTAETSVGTMMDGRPDKHMLTYRISNGETGFYKASITMGVFRLICTNGAVAPVVPEGALLRQRHYGINNATFQERLTTAMTTGNRVGHIAWEMVRSARGQTVSFPQNTIDRLASEMRLSDALAESIKEHYANEPEPSFYGVINAFTSTARDQPDSEKREELEKLSARLLKIGQRGLANRYDGPQEEVD